MNFEYETITLFGSSFQKLLLSILSPHCRPTTPRSKLLGLAFFAFARRYLRNHSYFLFLQLLRCFSSLRYLSICYVFTDEWQAKLAGFPHSEIAGSKRTYSSPTHIVVSHVLRRLLVPRHPPCALINFAIKYIIYLWIKVIVASILKTLIKNFIAARINFHLFSVYCFVSCYSVFNDQIWKYNIYFQWRITGSNRWPPACKAGALPAELIPHRLTLV